MRILFLLPAICLFGTSPDTINSMVANADTTSIIHLLDGNIAEWPAEKFMIDKATKVEYTVDNDNETLFLVINVPEQAIQKRIMQEGLNCYIDTKGKKRENKGIEFPSIIGNIASIENMKLFGFAAGDAVILNIKNQGTVNIAIAWDSSFIMHIEYNIPLKFLEATVADLNNKKISIGWKVNESTTPSLANPASNPSNTTTVARLVAVPAGTRPSGNRSAPNVSNVNNNNSSFQPGSNKTSPIWASHTISF